MSTTLNKLEYLDETKSQIKTALNQFGSGITDEDTFRSYASKIENIYNNWPKVTGSGESVTLNNTKAGKMQLNLKGNTSQETTEGKNKLGYNPSTGGYNGVTYKVNDDGTIIFNGTCTADNTILLNLNTLGNLDLDSLPAGATLSIFYVSGSISGGTTQYRIYNSNYSANLIVDFSNLSSSNPLIFASRTSAMTPYSNNCNFRVNNGCTFDNLTIKIMLTETEDTEYERYTNGVSPNPDYPQTIQVVKGTNMILSNTINLYDSNTALLEKKLDDNGEIEDSSYYFTSDFIEVTGSTNYTYTKIRDQSTHNSYMCQYDENKLLIKRDIIPLIMTFRTIETQANTKYVRISGVLEDVNITVLELGDKSTVYPITLPEGMEMCKIGDYADEFVYQNNTWYKNKKIFKLILDGTEYWTKATTKTNTSRFYITRSNITELNAATETPFIICDNFKIYDFESVYNGDFQSISQSAQTGQKKRVHISLSNNYATTVDGLKSWLAQKYQNNNPVIIYYVLETPVPEEITDTTLIQQLNNIKNVMSYDTQTVITQTNEDLPFIISAAALKKGGN